MANYSMVWFLLCLIVGLYFLNLGFNFFTIPDAIKTSLGTWTYIIGGAFIIIGGAMSFGRNPRRYRGRY